MVLEEFSKKVDSSITEEQKQKIMAALLYEVDAYKNGTRKTEVYKVVSHVTLDFEGNVITVVANPYYFSRFTNYKRS